MRQILWFRRDLRINDNAILAHTAKGATIFPIFIFDPNILAPLPKDDKRVSFIYQSVLQLKADLRSLGLDLAIFFDTPTNVFRQLAKDFDSVLCSCDFDSYALTRDKEIEAMIPMERFYDSYLIHPNEGLKSDGTPYKVFTPFYKNLAPLWQSHHIEEISPNLECSLFAYDYDPYPSLIDLGFVPTLLPPFLIQTPSKALEATLPKINHYQVDRDYFHKDGTSNLSVFLRFGLLSPKQIFNKVRLLEGGEFFIRELFWREFYGYILYHFPSSEDSNFIPIEIPWENDEVKFQAWCEGRTGVPIIDAAMIHLNTTGLMPNRLRMIVASFLTKNLLIDWRWGERYFALKLLDYEASSNIGSWQWGASTGADSVPYFRVFNPYTQSEKFDPEAIFIKRNLPHLAKIAPKMLHQENKTTIVSIKESAKKAIEVFKKAKEG